MTRKRTDRDGREDAPDEGPERSRDRARVDLPRNLKKVFAAIRSKNLKKNAVERDAGVHTNWLHDRETKYGELTAAQAWRLSEVIDVPFAYLVDDEIELQDPPPPRSLFESDAILYAAKKHHNLEPQDLVDGMRVLDMMKMLKLDVELVANMLADQAVARKAYLAGQGNGRHEVAGPTIATQREEGESRSAVGSPARTGSETVGQRAVREQRERGGPNPPGGKSSGKKGG